MGQERDNLDATKLTRKSVRFQLEAANATHEADPPQQNTDPLHEYTPPSAATNNTDAAMKEKVLNGQIKTGIADAGASTSCGEPEISDCGRFRIKGDVFNSTGRKSEKYSNMQEDK